MTDEVKQTTEEVVSREDMNPEPEVEVTETTTEESVETSVETVEETVPKSQFDQVLARAKKAENALKAQKPSSFNNALSKEDAEALILASQGLSVELIGELKTLAKLRGKSLIETQGDPIFVAIKEKFDSDAKQEKAKLPASRGSGQMKKEKTINDSGLSDEEHKEIWKRSQGR
jgi:hypothetical protein